MKMFQQSVRDGYVPSGWTRANVAHDFKKGAKGLGFPNVCLLENSWTYYQLS